MNPAHAPLEVWQVLDDLWKAPCACGDSWEAPTKKVANRLRGKHLHRIAVARRIERERAVTAGRPIMKEPVLTHRMLSLTEQLYGGWVARCTCREEWTAHGKLQTLKGLHRHLSEEATRFRKMRNELLLKDGAA